MIYILHHNDEDGFGSAYSAWSHFGPEAKYVEMSYGKPVPYLSSDADVYMIDYTLPREETEELAASVKSLTIIDHHKSAEEEIGDLPYVYINQEHSAAVLAWEYFNPEVPVPLLLRYVEDMDLWHWSLPKSKQFFYYLSTQPRTFSGWDKIKKELERPDALSSPMFNQGQAIYDYVKVHIEGIEDRTMRLLTIGGFEVPTVNTPLLQAETGNYLANKHKDFPFVAGYYFGVDGKVHFSLVSEGAFDVSTIAKKYGGGGHKNASGFIVDNLEAL